MKKLRSLFSFSQKNTLSIDSKIAKKSLCLSLLTCKSFQDRPIKPCNILYERKTHHRHSDWLIFRQAHFFGTVAKPKTMESFEKTTTESDFYPTKHVKNLGVFGAQSSNEKGFKEFIR